MLLNKIAATAFDARYSSSADVDIHALRDREALDPKVNITEYFTYFRNGYSRLHPFTYILMQDVARKLELPVEFNCELTTREDLNTDFFRFMREDSDWKIMFLEIAPSVFGSGRCMELRLALEEHTSKENQLARDKICQSVNGQILGISRNHNSRRAIIFLEKNQSGSNRSTILQLEAMMMLYKELFGYLSMPLWQPLAEKVVEYNTCGSTNREVELKHEIKAAIVAYCETLDMFKEDPKKELLKIMERMRNTRLKGLKAEIERDTNCLNSALSSVAQWSAALDQANYQYAMAVSTPDTKVQDAFEDALDFCDRSPAIIKYLISDDKLKVSIKVPLSVSDEDEWETASKGYYKGSHAFREIINKCFIEHKYDLIGEATVGISLSDYQIQRENSDGKSYVCSAFNGCPNPHIMGYSCFGSHAPLVAEMLKDCNIEGVIEQAIEACSVINWSDAPVADKLLAIVTYNRNIPMFQDRENGNLLTYEELENETNSEE